ncbi:hypothetical protein cypCar_00043497 [Cyprinus carpio]|nr:hypothetical protein cypCar_00043497 [Cyprinus carpio]
MDTLALEATQPKKAQNGALVLLPGPPIPAKRKPAKKTKKAVVFFEVEILDAKTKDKLCFLDKVFLTEYAGPLLIYLMFYFRVPFIYVPKYDFTTSKHWVVHLACMCHSFHYVKRLLETLFVHRFSHGTMPLRNIFKFCQIGNFSIHIALRNLRPPGSKTRKIPYPTKNPFTWIFLLVSCPNYTYELGSWLGFTLMTQCLPVAAFTLVGFIQMTVWAKGKHRSYLKEFRDYPTLRSPILPFIL